MKKILLIFLILLLFGCNDNIDTPNTDVLPSENIKLEAIPTTNIIIGESLFNEKDLSDFEMKDFTYEKSVYKGIKLLDIFETLNINDYENIVIHPNAGNAMILKKDLINNIYITFYKDDKVLDSNKLIILDFDESTWVNNAKRIEIN